MRGGAFNIFQLTARPAGDILGPGPKMFRNPSSLLPTISRGVFIAPTSPHCRSPQRLPATKAFPTDRQAARPRTFGNDPDHRRSTVVIQADELSKLIPPTSKGRRRKCSAEAHQYRPAGHARGCQYPSHQSVKFFILTPQFHSSPEGFPVCEYDCKSGFTHMVA